MSTRKSLITGAWRILSMELWDRDYLDLEVPAHITFGRDRLGSFQFGAVEGGIDYRLSESDGLAKVEFSWEGFNDRDASSGRGCAILADIQLKGRFFFHNGDESEFMAVRVPSATGKIGLMRSAAKERATGLPPTRPSKRKMK